MGILQNLSDLPSCDPDFSKRRGLFDEVDGAVVQAVKAAEAKVAKADPPQEVQKDRQFKVGYM